MRERSSAADLLVEIGTEELPPTSLRLLAESFHAGLMERIVAAGLGHESSHWFATPRRLAVTIDGLDLQQPSRVEELKGPPARVAFDEHGQPTRAAAAFAKKCGIEPAALELDKTDKGAWLVHRKTIAGLSSADLIPGFVADALVTLPVERRMRWGAGEAEFVRPVQWVVLMHGREVLDGELFAQRSGRLTFGHRFHAPGPIELALPSEYAARLEDEGFVIADFDRRRALICSQIHTAAQSLDAKIEPDDALLDEITSMVEWPSAVTGRFDAGYLELPREVLISTLKKHQRYFPVIGADGELEAHFITIANIDSKDPARIAAGNERVVAPRLADAEYFWRSDRKKRLDSRLERLESIVYQRELGSIYDKSARAACLAAAVADALQLDPAAAERAAMLARCDLVTAMVGEFPDLQGIMGAYYARADGEPEAIADAIAEFYRPAFAGDSIPASPLAKAVVIADRLDTLAGIFAIGKRPSGNRDPFGLRRAALGLARTIVESDLEIDIVAMIDAALELQPTTGRTSRLATELYDFIVERLRSYFPERNPAVTHEVFEAVLQRRPGSLNDFRLRLDAVIAFQALDAADSLAAANKRISNILKQAAEAAAESVETDRLIEPAETALFDAYCEVRAAVMPRLECREYSAALDAMARLRGPIDRFFDEVLVMSEDERLKQNRLGLLAGIRGLFLKIADISVLSRN